MKLDESQKPQLHVNVKKAERDLKETVWRTYHKIMLLGKNNDWQTVDLGLVHSSAADTLVTYVLNRLSKDGHVEEGISPNFLVRNWPPAFIEWSTKGVRNAFFSTPLFPRLLNPDSIKESIARGVANGIIAYVGKTPDGRYKPFEFESTLAAADEYWSTGVME